MERADSCATNPHKLHGAPLQASLFLTTHKGALERANAANAAYLFQPDKNFRELDLGDLTIQCGRKTDAVKVRAKKVDTLEEKKRGGGAK